MLRSGDRLDVMVEKPAAGGRMIARHEGQVLLVSGAIPGERVAVRIERVDKRLAFAATIDVLTPSPSRGPRSCRRRAPRHRYGRADASADRR